MMGSNDKMTYESAVKRLEEIVNLLDNGNASLDESMKLYEEGIELSSFCEKKLSEAKQKITEIEK